MDEDIKIYASTESEIQEESDEMKINILLYSESFTKSFDTQRLRAEYAESEVEGKIKNMKRDLFLQYGEEIIHDDTHRIKTKNSTAEKMVRKKYKNIEQVTDILGWRIIVKKPSDIWKVSDKIDEWFEVYFTKDYIIDPKPPEYGGYTGAIHKKIHYQTTCGGKKVSVPMEIQVTALMTGAFWVLEHDSNYKCKRENPHAVEDNQIVLECINLIYEVIEQRTSFQNNPDAKPDGSKISEHVKKIVEMEQKRNHSV